MISKAALIYFFRLRMLAVQHLEIPLFPISLQFSFLSLPFSHQAVVGQLSSVRQLSGSHQAAIQKLSSRHRAFLGQLSGNLWAIFRQSINSRQTIIAQPCRLKGFLVLFRSRIKQVKQVLNLIEIIVVVSTNIFQARGKFPSNKMNSYTSRTGLLHTSKIQMNIYQMFLRTVQLAHLFSHKPFFSI